MKKKLKKKELEKVNGGVGKPAPTFGEQQGGQDTNQNGEEKRAIPILFFGDDNLDTNQQSGGNSVRGLH